MSRTHAIPTRKPPAAFESHQSIDKQVLDYLSSGGKIQTVAVGVTGQMGISTAEFTVASKSVRGKNKLH